MISFVPVLLVSSVLQMAFRMVLSLIVPPWHPIRWTKKRLGLGRYSRTKGKNLPGFERVPEGVPIQSDVLDKIEAFARSCALLVSQEHTDGAEYHGEPSDPSNESVCSNKMIYKFIALQPDEYTISKCAYFMPLMHICAQVELIPHVFSENVIALIDVNDEGIRELFRKKIKSILPNEAVYLMSVIRVLAWLNSKASIPKDFPSGTEDFESYQDALGDFSCIAPKPDRFGNLDYSLETQMFPVKGKDF
ncbi:hypothetical protein RF11_03011 [Thelohanellus kitauei]|uniref:Uncharacterized protein n=1 Tax=Thelohanellus kitauei TaxID=669202 RepID=A0A0C2MVF9_THEKT|nr:hypothetical protein RF11_03011 [Thelohanellus kitauei]